ncbi:MAG TPA: DUF1552 domain-containing protein [Polyangia bacterium]
MKSAASGRPPARSVRSPARRAFLRGVGAGLASVPFFKVLENSYAEAAGDAPIARFVTLYHPHGIAAELWGMQTADTASAISGGATESTNFSLTFSNSTLQPFDDAGTYGKSWKSKILVIEGLDLMSNANGHDSAGTILTGSRIDSAGSKPLNSSLDQFLAVEKKLGAGTAVTSIALGVGTDDTKSGSTLSYGMGGAALPKIIDPVQAFNTLFGNFAAPNDSAAQAALARQQKQGKSILDFIRGDIGRLRPRLAAAEKQKLDQHLDALGDLEKQIVGVSTMTGGGGGGGASCATMPTKPDASKFPKLKAYNGGEPYFDAITDAHLALIAQAFACDITRFATLFMADLSYAGNPLNLPTDNHGSVAHVYSGSPMGSDGHPVGAGDPATWALLGKFNKYAYGKVASLMKQLDAFGVLDSSLIYASSDMGNPALHSTRNVPTILAGGSSFTKFRMGRRLRVQADCPSSSPWCAPGDANFTGVSNNHLLVAIAKAFGVDVNTFGTQPTTDLTTGVLAGLI